MSVPWIKFAVSAAGLCAVVWWTDAADVLAQLQGLEPLWVMVALAALTFATACMAHRWQLTARSFGVEISYATALREYYLGQLINTVLPGGVAGDMARAVRTRHAVDLARAAQSVIAERLLGQIAMLGLMGAGFATVLLLPGGLDWAGIDAIVLVALLASGTALWLAAQRDNRAARFIRHTAHLLTRQTILLHGMVCTLSLILAFYACARAIGTFIPPSGWLTLVPLILCAMLIPLSVGGWGWREGAAAALFPIIGAPASAGIATGITYGFVLLIAAVPAGVILLVHSLANPLSAKRTPDTS